jgi:penicillin-binding protein 1C
MLHIRFWQKYKKQIKRISLSLKMIDHTLMRMLLATFATIIVVALFLQSHKLLTYSEKHSQLIFGNNGKLLNATLAADEQWRFSPETPVPEKLKQAIITFEDKRFYTHVGVDLQALGRAIVQNIREWRIASGASTLTMQVARLGRPDAARTFAEKALEIVIALRLETLYAKDEIIRLWAAYAPFGSNIVGMEAAAWRYFGRSPADLSWAEASLLAILPNAPSMIYPGKNHHLLKPKRDRLLYKLRNNGVIDTLTCTLALEEELPQKFYSMPRKLPHLSQHIELISPSKTNRRFITSIDPGLQQRLEQLASRYQKQYATQMIRNIAIVVAETGSGKILGYIGNAGKEKMHGSHVDIVQSIRSTGSLLKPFLYAGAISEGTITPHELLTDLPVNYAGYSPKNYSNQYFGAIPADEALSRSLNVPMVRLLRTFTTSKFHRRLKEMGMHSLNKSSSHYGLSLILGGSDATLFELSGMYAAMGRTLLNYTRLSGAYLKDNYHALHLGNYAPNNETYNQPPLTAGAIWHTLEAMQNLKRPTEEGRWQQFSSSRRIAWKTGTSYGFRDAWAIGLDPEYTVGVWVGNANGEPRNGLVGVHKAGPVLFDVFRLLPASDNWFPTPWDDLKETEICEHSGKIASKNCPQTKKDFIPAIAARSGSCTFCRPVLVSPDLSTRFYRQCAPQNYIDTAWFVLPASQEWYYRKHNSQYQTLPPLSKKCSGDQSNENPIAIIYPHSGSQLVIPVNIHGEKNEIVFQAVHKWPGTQLFWYLNNQFIAQTTHYHQIGIKPEIGLHTLLIEDPEGNRRTMTFQIVPKKMY